MTAKVAINGFGRIGRNVPRAIVESGRSDIDGIAINDPGPARDNAPCPLFTCVFSAGGAFLEWLEGRTLPGVAALMQDERV